MSGRAPVQRWALLAGAGKETDLSLMWSVLQGLDAARRPEDRAFLAAPGLTGEAALQALEARHDGPADQELWVFLVGRLVLKRKKLILVFGDEGTGLRLDELAAALQEVPAGRRVVVLEVEDPDGVAAELDALEWPALDLRVAGEHLPEALTQALLHGAPGLRTAGQVAAAVGGATQRPAAVLNVLAASAAVAPVDPQAERRLREYLQALLALSEHLPFQDLRDDRSLPGLQAVYVEPHTQAPEEEARGRERPGGEREAKVTLHDALARARCLFLEGEPGSGKTTFINRVVSEVCRHRLENLPLPEGLPAQPFPVVVPLRDFAAGLGAAPPSAEALWRYAFSRLTLADSDQTLDPAVARAALEDGRLVLFLDGLDEVPDPERRRQVATVITDLARTCRRLKVVVTCRPAAARAGARPGDPFEARTVAPFDDEERLLCVTHWLRQRADGGAAPEAEARRLLTELALHPRVADQARNPLVLTMVCILFRKQGSLPKDRADLYERLISLLLEDRSRGWGGPAKDVPLDQRWDALTRVAVAWREAATGGDVEGALLLEPACVAAIQGSVHDEVTARDLVWYMEQRTALLEWRGMEQGKRKLAFAHRTIAEYLVAGHLATQVGGGSGSVPELLKAHAADGDYREVARLFVAIIARGRHRNPQPAEDLIRWLVDEAKNEARAWAHRAACGRLAAECRAEWLDKVPEPVSQAVDGLQGLFRDPERGGELPAVERVDFWEAIGAQARDLDDRHRWVEVPGGRYWRGAVPGDEEAEYDEKPGAWVDMAPFSVQRWPVTVAEFAAFVAAGGYGPEGVARYWSPSGQAFFAAEPVGGPDGWLGQRYHPTRPVTGVSWFEAQAYAAWLDATWSGPRPEGAQVHLPSELQWEAGARGARQGEVGAQWRYPWEGDFDDNRANRRVPGRYGPSPVGAFPGGRTLGGAWDMSGNVWEWCLDALVSDAYRQGFAPRFDPKEAVAPDSGRVCRGGSFVDSPWYLRVSYRHGIEARRRFVYLGFRVVLSSLPRTLGP